MTTVETTGAPSESPSKSPIMKETNSNTHKTLHTSNPTISNINILTPAPKSSNSIPLNSLDDEHDSFSSHGSSSDSLLSLSFNQDGGCLAVGTTSGFRIYNVFPFQETFRRTFDNPNDAHESSSHNSHTAESTNSNSNSNSNSQTNGIGIVEMLFRCNLLALVGGGPSPRYPPNKVMIWDDHRGRCIGELSFRQRVLSVKLRRDRVAVALMDRVYVYNFSDLTLLDQIHTAPNPLGLLSLSPDVGGISHTGTGQSVGMVLACPSINRGGVRVELYGCRKTVLIDAHESSLAALSLSLSGTLLATASERGTLIRLFSTKDKNGTLLRELRRGVERAHIYCIAFSMENQWLAATSDRGTAHIFYLGDKMSTDDNHSPYPPSQNHSPTPYSNNFPSMSSQAQPKFSSILTSPKKFLQSKRILWEGEGSYAQIRGVDDPVVCAFVPDKPMTIAIVGKTDGSILLADFSKGSGEAERVAYHRFIKGTRTNDNTILGSGRNGDSKDDGADNVAFNEEEIIFGDEDAADGFVTIEKAGD